MKFFGVVLFMMVSFVSLAQEVTVADRLERLIVSELMTRYPHSKVNVDKATLNQIQVQESSAVARVHDFKNDGSILVSIGTQYFDIPVSVEKEVWVPNKRVMPNEALDASDFSKIQIHLEDQRFAAKRDLLFQAEKISGLRSKRTLLPNDPLLETAVESIPDVERGESVQVVIQSGLLELVAPARAEEEGHIGDLIRVMTLKSKRIFEGKLQKNRTVEVSL